MTFLYKSFNGSNSLFLLILLILGNTVFSQTVWIENGVPIITVQHSQEQIKITSDENGGAIIVWQDHRITGDLNIYAQRVDGSGNILWSNMGVLICNAVGDQYTPEIVPDHEGGAIIVWRDYRTGVADIYAQRVNASGEVMWQNNGLPISTAVGEQKYPQISYDDVNNLVIISWQDQRNGDWDIYAQKLTVYGDVIWQTDGVPVCQFTSNQMFPLVIADNIFQASIFIWIDDRNEMESLYIQRLDANGIIQWEADGKLVNGSVQGELFSQNIGITTDLEGGVIITWGFDYIYDEYLFAQRIDDTGAFWWNDPGIIVSTVSSLSGVDIFTDLGPGAYICWVDNNQIYAQHVSDGTNTWSDGVSVAPSANVQSKPKLIFDYDNDIIVTWQESAEIKAQSIDTNGNIQWGSNGIFITNINEVQTMPQICKDGSGGAVIAWEDFRNEQINTDIYIQRVNNSIAVELTLLYPNGNELLAGGSNYTIQWSATNTDQFDHYLLAYTTDDGSNYTVIANNIIPTTATSYEWTVPNINSTNVKILIQALSADNNTIYDEDKSDAVFTIDSSPPSSFNLISPVNGTWTDAMPDFVWDASGGADYYQIWIDGILTEDNIIFNIGYITNPLSAGWHTWTVKAIDAVGNVTQADNTWSIQVDLYPPDAFNLINPEHDTWTNDPYTEFGWEPSNDMESGLDKYMIYMDDILKYVDYYPENGITYTYGDIIGFNEGIHTWFVKAVDNVNNKTNTDETRIIKLDTTPPEGNAPGHSLYFDGDEDYVEVPHSNILNPSSQITIEAWIKFETGGLQNPRIAGKGTGWGIGYELFTLGTSNSRRFSFALRGTTISSSIYYSSGEWHHIAGVYNGNTMKLYIDGVERASRNKTGLFPPGTGSFKIGKKSHHWSDDDFKGEIDEVRVWNIARTQAEILADMDNIISSTETGLIGYWRFDEGTGSQVADLTNNQNYGNLIGNTSFTINPNLIGTSFALVSPLDDYWTSNSTPTFVWNTAVDTGIGNSHYQLWLDDSLYVDNIPFTDTTYTLSAGSELTNGSHSWFVKAFDLLGNNSRSNLVHTINIDLEPPNSFSLLTPDDSAYVTFPTPNFSWYQSWDTGSGISHFQLWIDSTLNVDNISGYVSSPSSPLTEGPHTWFVRAIDNVGNIQTTETRIVFGEWSSPLPFDLVSPVDGDTVQTSTPVFSWHPSADAGTGLQKYQLWIGNSLNRDNIAPVDTSATSLIPLENGTYNWYVKALDFAGNTTSSNSNWSIIVDADYVPPVSQIIYPSDGDTIVGVSLVIQGTSNDGSGIGVDSVFLSTDNGLSWNFVQKVNNSYDQWIFNWNNLNYGDYTILCRAKDLANNMEIPGDSVKIHIRNLLPYIVNPLPDLFLLEDALDTALISLDSVFSDLNVGDTLLYTDEVIPPEIGVSVFIDEDNNIPTIHLKENWNGNAQVVFTASDNQLDVIRDTIEINVTSINDTPIVSDIPDTSIFENKTISISLSDYVSDADLPNDHISWSYSGGDSLLVSINNDTAIICHLPGWTGIDSILFVATDDSLASDSDWVRIVIIPIPRPTNLIATSGLAYSVPLIWNTPAYTPDEPEPQIEELIYDDGSPSNAYTWGNGAKMANRLTPSWPCRILEIKFYHNTPGLFKPGIFSWTGNQPGSNLLEFNHTSTSQGWISIDVSSYDIQVTGDFVVSNGLLNSTVALGYDPVNNSRAWDWNGSSWSSWSETYFIRAVVQEITTGRIAVIGYGMNKLNNDINKMVEVLFEKRSHNLDKIPEIGQIAKTHISNDYSNNSIVHRIIPRDILSHYNVYRSEVLGGSFTQIATDVLDTTFNDVSVELGTMYHYVVTAVYSDPQQESGYSNETSATTAFPPVIGTLPDTSFNEDENLVVTISSWFSFVDDGDTPDEDLTWLLTGYDNLFVNQLDSSFIFTSALDWHGQEPITVIVSDGQLRDTTVFSISVLSVPDDPIVSNPLEDITFNEDEIDSSINLSVVFYDGDGDSLVFNFTGNESIDISIINSIVFLNPDSNWHGSNQIVFTAFDGISYVSDSVLITVLPVNDYPQIFNLIMPDDSTIIEITNNNLNDSLIISWEESIDVDGDTVMYIFIPSGKLSIFNIGDTTKTELQMKYSDIFEIMKANAMTSINGTWTIHASDGNLVTEAANGPFTLSFDATSVGIIGEIILPTEFALHQNYSNPFNPVTTLRYDLPENSFVNINIYDMLGRKVRSLIEQNQEAGYKSVMWDGTNEYGKLVSAGVYLYRIQAGEYVQTKKMVLLK